MARALRSGRLAGAGCEVHYGEPTSPDEPLLQFGNVIPTPLMGGAPRMNSLQDAEAMLLDLHAELQTPVPEACR